MAWWDRFARPRGRHEAPATRRLTPPGSLYYQTFPLTPGRESVGNDFRTYAESGYQGNGVVFAVANQRLMLVSQAEFKWQDLASRRLYGTPDLTLLEQPWPNGTAGDLLARMVQDVDLAGNAYVHRVGDRLERLRPDLVDIVARESMDGALEVIGFAYWRNGRHNGDPELYDEADVAHWAPLPHDLLAHVSNRITNEVRGINRVVYDISSKPPSTIEWE